MEVEIISRDCIKPSSPTPTHLKTYNLCLLDQLFGNVYTHVVLYYPLNHDKNLFNSTDSDIDDIVSKRLQLLKQSLSETLTSYYPFAGKIKDIISVDCNDEGIYFVEARAKCSINEFLSKPNLSLISKFVPAESNKHSEEIVGAYVAMIQVTTFACGGLSICTSVSHMFGDGKTIGLFLKSWAAIARENTKEALIFPNYEASSLFPPNDKFPIDASSTLTFAKTSRFVTRRFVFDAKAIANLKAKAASSCVQNPTRVEAVTALLSKCIMAAIKTKSGFHKPTLLTHAVNLRRKIKSPISDYLIGNILWGATAVCKEEEIELDGLVYRLREAITKINGDFVKGVQGEDGFLNLCKAIQDESEMSSNAEDRIIFTSWCKFGYYNTDFGWGKPIWISYIGSNEAVTTSFSTIILMDTRLEDGIDAWVLLPEEDMAFLELDQELLAFASLDLSPLGQD